MTDAPAPVFDGPPAAFIEADDRSVYVLAGTVLPRVGLPQEHPVLVLVAPGMVREYEAGFLPVFEFFKEPRGERHVRAWIDWAGVDGRFLNVLLATRAIVRVGAPGLFFPTVRRFRGLRVVPQCEPVPGSYEDGFVLVRRDAADTRYLVIHLELAIALYENDSYDIPSVVKLIAHRAGIPRDLAMWIALRGITKLLRYGHARFEWLQPPRVPRFFQLLKGIA